MAPLFHNGDRMNRKSQLDDLYDIAPKKDLPPFRMSGKVLFEMFCALVFLGMVGLVFYNAFLRYVFRSSFPPSEEWARFLFIYIIYFGAIEACYRKKHIAVDLLVSRLRGVTRRTVDIAASLLSLCALFLLLFGGWRIVQLTYDINSVATNVNMAIINCTLPIMALATIILTIRDLVKLLRSPIDPGPAGPQAEGEGN